MPILSEERAREHEAPLFQLKVALKGQGIDSLLYRNVTLRLVASYRPLEWREPELAVFADGRVAVTVSMSKGRYRVTGRKELSGHNEPARMAELIAAALHESLRDGRSRTG